MKLSHLLSLLLLLSFSALNAQTPLTSAIDFNVKTLDGEIIELFPLLNEGKIVVLDFFSTSCGPCQTFAYDFQQAYEGFGYNNGNVFFLGINYNGTNEDVRFFDSLFNITLPSASGLDGGGNKVFDTYLVAAYPTVIVIKPDFTISAQHVWEPTVENITEAVMMAGGLFVGTAELNRTSAFHVYPNPATQMIHIQSNVPLENSYVTIRNLAGKTVGVYSNHLSGISQSANEITLPVDRLTSGMYFVVITSKAGSAIKKIIVQK